MGSPGRMAALPSRHNFSTSVFSYLATVGQRCGAEACKFASVFELLFRR